MNLGDQHFKICFASYFVSHWDESPALSGYQIPHPSCNGRNKIQDLQNYTSNSVLKFGKCGDA